MEYSNNKKQATLLIYQLCQKSSAMKCVASQNMKWLIKKRIGKGMTSPTRPKFFLMAESFVKVR